MPAPGPGRRDTMPIAAACFDYVRALIRDEAGIVLDDAETTVNLGERFEAASFERTGCYRQAAAL